MMYHGLKYFEAGQDHPSGLMPYIEKAIGFYPATLAPSSLV